MEETQLFNVEMQIAKRVAFSVGVPSAFEGQHRFPYHDLLSTTERLL